MKTCQDLWDSAPDDTDSIITRMMYFYEIDQPPVVFDHKDLLELGKALQETANKVGFRRFRLDGPVDPSDTITVPMTKVANCDQNFEVIIERESKKRFNVGESILLNTLLKYATSHIDEYATIGSEDQIKYIHFKEAAILFKAWLEKKLSDHLIISDKQTSSKRLKEITQELFHMEQDMVIQDGYLDIAGVNVPKYVLASTPNQYQLLLQKEAGSIEITNIELFKSEIANKYQDKIDYIDNELTAEERVQFFEYKQQFVAFIKWLKQENDQILEGGLFDLALSDNIEDKAGCKAECIGVLHAMGVIGRENNLIGDKNKASLWLKWLVDTSIIHDQNNDKERASVLNSIIKTDKGKEFKNRSIGSNNIAADKKRDLTRNFKPEIEKIAAAYLKK